MDDVGDVPVGAVVTSAYAGSFVRDSLFEA
jgi:hypothetical protein